MKLKNYCVCILLSGTSFLVMAEDCKSVADTSSVAKLKEVSESMKKSELKAVADKSPVKAIQLVTEPTKVTCSSVSYKIPEVPMKPGEGVYFHVPAELRDRGVRFMVIGHRQEPGPNFKPGEWDDNPGLSSVQVLSKDKWSYWNGPASGKKGAKFAEVRSYPEIENLYDWSNYGHKDIETEEASTEKLLPEMMKVESVGSDTVYLSELTLKVEPFEEKSNTEQIFSPGTKFFPHKKDKKYQLGGGQSFEGTFPGAREVNPGNEISIPLKAGQKITSVDVACGDSHPDKIQNSDGGYGTQGWAKLSIGIQKPNGKITWIMSRENVPPEGVMMASPDDCDEKVESGSKLIIRSDSDTTYVMGVHVGYR